MFCFVFFSVSSFHIFFRSWTPKRASSECNLNKNARWDCLHYCTMLILYQAYDASALTWATCPAKIYNSIRHEATEKKESFSQDLIESIYLIHCNGVNIKTNTHTQIKAITTMEWKCFSKKRKKAKIIC